MKRMILFSNISAFIRVTACGANAFTDSSKAINRMKNNQIDMHVSNLIIT